MKKYSSTTWKEKETNEKEESRNRPTQPWKLGIWYKMTKNTTFQISGEMIIHSINDPE